jgi:hypothetical protein
MYYVRGMLWKLASLHPQSKEFFEEKAEDLGSGTTRLRTGTAQTGFKPQSSELPVRKATV